MIAYIIITSAALSLKLEPAFDLVSQPAFSNAHIEGVKRRENEVSRNLQTRNNITLSNSHIQWHLWIKNQY